MPRIVLIPGVMGRHIASSGSDERSLIRCWSSSDCICSQAFWALIHPPAFCEWVGDAVALAYSIATLREIPWDSYRVGVGLENTLMHHYDHEHIARWT